MNHADILDELAKELKDIMEDSYDIVVENPLTADKIAGEYKGVIHSVEDIHGVYLGKTYDETEEDDTEVSIRFDATGDGSIRASANLTIECTYDPETGTLDYHGTSSKGVTEYVHMVFNYENGT